jgi:ribosome-associated protein
MRKGGPPKTRSSNRRPAPSNRKFSPGKRKFAASNRKPSRDKSWPSPTDRKPAPGGRKFAASKRGPAPSKRKPRTTSPKAPTIRRPPARQVDASTPDDVRPLALEAVEAALEKQAERPVLLDVRQLSSYADYVLVLSGDNERQIEAISRAIEDRLRAKGKRVRGIESAAGESSWILMDFGDLIIHIFFREVRDFYDLEGLWHDAPRVSLPNAATSSNR